MTKVILADTLHSEAVFSAIISIFALGNKKQHGGRIHSH